MTLLQCINRMLRSVQRLRQSPESITTPLGYIPYQGVHIPKCYPPRVDDDMTLTRSVGQATAAANEQTMMRKRWYWYE